MVELSEFNKFRESDQSLKHKLRFNLLKIFSLISVLLALWWHPQGSHRSGKSGNILKTFSSQGSQGKMGFSAKIREKFQIREHFFRTILKPFSLRKMLFKTLKTFFRSCQEIALNEAIFA